MRLAVAIFGRTSHWTTNTATTDWNDDGYDDDDDDAPCFILRLYGIAQNDGLMGQGSELTHTASSFATHGSMQPNVRIMSYRQARQALLLHQQWLESTVRCHSTVALRDDPQSATHDNGKETVVVLAYLATNSMDYFLSFIAATSMAPIKDTSSSNHSITTTLPVLLNTRWTASEMVAALEPSSATKTTTTIDQCRRVGGGGGSRDQRCRHPVACHHTVLLYSNEFTAMATEVAQSLRREHHQVTFWVLPNFCQVPCGLTTTTTTTTSTATLNSIDQVSSDLTRRKTDADMPYLPVKPGSEATCVVATNKNDSGENDNDDDDNKDAVIVFTSGTGSGRAKGVRISCKALLVQCRAKLEPPCSYSRRTRLLSTTVPFFHVGGLSSLLAVLLARGALIVPIRGDDDATTMATTTTVPRSSALSSASFDPQLVWHMVDLPAAARSTTSALREESTHFDVSVAVNTLVVVPTMLHSLKEHYELTLARNGNERHHARRIVYPHVALIVIGGQSASPELRRFAQTEFPKARIVQTYACTEAASSLTFLSIPSVTSTMQLAAATRATASPLLLQSPQQGGPRMDGDCVGWPPQHIQLCIVPITTEQDKDRTTNNVQNDGRVPPYTAGIVATRGPHVMTGYWMRGHQQQQTKAATTLSWMRTGDLGYLDETGCLYLLGRVSDSIRTGGETVMAAEVERVIQLHPAVDECAVFGLRDEKYGETVCCAIYQNTTRTNKSSMVSLPLTVETVRHWCQRHGLAGYKRPRHVYLLNAPLPRNTSGKVLKYKLKQRFEANRALGSAPSRSNL